MLYVSEWFLILAFYASGIILLLIALRLARRQWPQAINLSALLLTFCLAYLLAGAIVALATPQRILHQGQPRFFDETGATAIAATRTPTITTDSTLHAQGVFFVVTTRIFNRSAKIPHHAPALDFLLQDANGNLHTPNNTATSLLNPNLDRLRTSLFGPAERRTLIIVFEVPTNTQRAVLIIRHHNPYALNRILLGDPEHFWHRNTVILLDK
jgi:hypothetical protein